MEIDSIAQPKCGEKSCPFPAVAGDSLCAYHVEMFAGEESPIESSFKVADKNIISALHFEDGVSARKARLLSSDEYREQEVFGKTIKNLHNRNHMARRAKRLRSAGLCPQCGGSKEAVSVRCAGCRRANRLRLQRTRSQRKKTGICTKCGKYRAINSLYCESCRDKTYVGQRRWQRALRKRRRETGFCTKCGAPKEQRYKQCKSCRLASTNKQRERKSLGTCYHCGGARDDPQRAACFSCRRRAVRSFSKKYQERKHAGICPRCKRNAIAKRHAVCSTCLLKQRDYIREYRRGLRDRHEALRTKRCSAKRISAS